MTAQLRALVAVARRVNAAATEPALAEAIARGAVELTGCRGAVTCVAPSDEEGLRVLAVVGEGWELGVGHALPRDGDGLAARALRESDPVSDGSGGHAVALHAADRAVGAIAVSSASPELGEGAALALAALANHAGLALASLRTMDELVRQASHLETIVECSPDAIITTDTTGCITFFSPGAEELFGYRPDAVLGSKVSTYYANGERDARTVQQYIEDEGKVRNYEAWFKTARGEPVPASLSASVLRDRHGEVRGTVGILKDITVEKQLEHKLSYTIEMLQDANENLGKLAVTDSLSGLRNQRFFRRKLLEEMHRSARTRRPLSLLLIDIDKFKRCNDTFGHQVGDRVIQEIGETIQESIRKVDDGCRYGGEEFTVILPETAAAQADVVARRIQRAFADRRAWEELGVTPPTLSIGIACFEPGDDHGTAVDADPFIKRADDAMYAVKRRGGDGIAVL